MSDQIQTLREIRAEATADAITGATDCKYPEGSMAQAVYWEQRQKDMHHLSADWSAAQMKNRLMRGQKSAGTAK